MTTATVDDDTLQHYATLIRKHGPNRVVVDENGYAVSPKRAKRDYGRTKLDVIFIRSDGWSLGASADLAAVAEANSPNHWIGVLRPSAERAERYVRPEAAQT
jgi:hypothetical protein